MEIDKYLYAGFYPRIYDRELNPSEWYRNYIEAYLEKDIRSIIKIQDLSLFHKFLRLTAGRTGQILNMSSLGNEIGCSHNTIREWLSVLETSFIVFFLQPYYKSFNKRIVKSPKLYFYDTGLVSALLSIDNSEQLETHYIRGQLFENLVISEILKYFYAENREPRMYFWKIKTGYEVDCVIDSPQPSAIEIKSGQTIHNNFFQNLKIFKELNIDSNPLLFLIYGGDEEQIRSHFTVLPWRKVGRIFTS